MTEAPSADPSGNDMVRCQRCDMAYPADEPGCPRCRRIRQSNILIATTLVMLVVLALVGWLGMQVLFM